MTAFRRLTAPLRRISVQIALLSLLSMLLTAGIVSAITFSMRDKDERQDLAQIGAFMTLARLLGEVAPEDRPATLAATRRAFPQLDISLQASAPAEPPVLQPSPIMGMLSEEIGRRLRVTQIMDDHGGGPQSEPIIRVATQVAPEAYLVARLPELPPPPHFLQIGGVALFFGITLVIVVPWVAWWVARPLDRFARAAAEFSLDAEHEALPETGPDEVRLAARSFNIMRRRIADLVADRTRMLAAVGHDLRTPITRLRLRVEFIETGDVKAALLKDLDHMHRLVEGALAFLKGGRPPVDRSRIDISALVQTVGDEFAELGAAVTAIVPDDRIMVLGRLDGLQRALDNLVENALRYGQRADIALCADAETATVEIVDDGPGIAPERQAEMLQPFVRGDAARGTDPTAGAEGGLGLGLSIAAAIVAEHRGTLAFARTAAGRFCVRMTLPRD